MNRALLALDPQPDSSAAFFDMIVRNASVPVVRCGFDKGAYLVGGASTKTLCDAEVLQQNTFRLSLQFQRSWNYVTEEQSQTIRTRFETCWLDCGMWRAAAQATMAAIRFRADLKRSFLRYVRTVCESPSSCLEVTTDMVKNAPAPPGLPTSSTFLISRIFAVTAISVNCVLIALALGIAVVVFVWKVGCESIRILVIVLGLVTGFVFDINYYAASLSLATQQLFESAHTLVRLVLFCVYVE